MIPTGLLLRAGAALALALAMVTGYGWIRHSGVVQGRAEVQSQWDADRLAVAKQTLRIIENNTRATQILQAHANQGRKALRDEIRRIDDDRAAALERLRDRPQRPDAGGAVVPGDSGPGGGFAGATGAQLYREDGEFLAGEAARAERLRVELSACYVRYRAAREAVNGAGK